jgi:hypothetical protein
MTNLLCLILAALFGLVGVGGLIYIFTAPEPVERLLTIERAIDEAEKMLEAGR